MFNFYLFFKYIFPALFLMKFIGYHKFKQLHMLVVTVINLVFFFLLQCIVQLLLINILSVYLILQNPVSTEDGEYIINFELRWLTSIS